MHSVPESKHGAQRVDQHRTANLQGSCCLKDRGFRRIHPHCPRSKFVHIAEVAIVDIYMIVSTMKATVFCFRSVPRKVLLDQNRSSIDCNYPLCTIFNTLICPVHGSDDY